MVFSPPPIPFISMKHNRFRQGTNFNISVTKGCWQPGVKHVTLFCDTGNLIELGTSVDFFCYWTVWTTTFNLKKKNRFPWNQLDLGISKMVSFPNNHGVFLLKMIMTWGVKWGYPASERGCITTPFGLKSAKAIATQLSCAGSRCQTIL